jgi:hypothetical protein
MTDPPNQRQTKPPGVPGWVKISAAVAAVVIVLIVVVALISGGEHGPSRHFPGGDNPGSHTPPAQHSP